MRYNIRSFRQFDMKNVFRAILFSPEAFPLVYQIPDVEYAKALDFLFLRFDFFQKGAVNLG